MTGEIFIGCLGVFGTVVAILATFVLNEIAASLRKLTEGQSLLNERMATIVERVDSHEKRLTVIETKH